jgi:hypothetical protein
MFQVRKALAARSLARRAVRGGMLALALVQIPLAGQLFSSPVTALAAAGYGTTYQAAVICDPMVPKQIKMRGFAAAAPELSRQWIRVRFEIDKWINGAWRWVPLDGGYSTTPWYAFVHDRRYTTYGASDWVTYTMNLSGAGTYRVDAQYSFLLSGTTSNGTWTPWSSWIFTTQYQNLPYSELHRDPYCYL